MNDQTEAPSPDDNTFRRTWPHSTEAEACLLSSMLLNEAACDEVLAESCAGFFFLTDHAIVYTAISQLRKRRAPIDAVMVRDELKGMGVLERIGGPAYIAQMMITMPSADHWRGYLDTVREHYRRRKLISIGDEIMRCAYDPGVDPLRLAQRFHTMLTAFLASAATNAPPASSADVVSATIEAYASGRLSCLSFPWAALSQLSQALRPGTVTVLAGGAGDSKSLMVLQAFAFWVRKGIQASIYELEEDRSFHLMRCLAQLSGRAGLTSPEWVRSHEALAKSIDIEYRDTMEQIGASLWDAPNKVPTLDDLAAWIHERARQGDRIIVVDPVSRARVSDRRHIDDERFVGEVAAIARAYGCSILCVTHPVKTTKGRPSLGDLAGGAAWTRFAQCVLYLERVEPARNVRCLDFTLGQPFNTTVNRRLSLLKTRSGPGAGKLIGFEFDPLSLTFTEQGQITREDSDVGETANAS